MKYVAMYTTLREKMREDRITYEDLADLLDIHINSAGNKVRGTQPITIDEAIKIRDELFPEMTIEELFKKE